MCVHAEAHWARAYTVLPHVLNLLVRQEWRRHFAHARWVALGQPLVPKDGYSPVAHAKVDQISTTSMGPRALDRYSLDPGLH
eukprot:10348587-Karenia_brevis.AAC.1